MIRIYRRHAEDCSCSKASQTNCSCPIWLQWQENLKQIKLSVKGVHEKLYGTAPTRDQCQDWAFAEKVKYHWQEHLEQATPLSSPVKITLADAVSRYLADKQALASKGGMCKDTVDNNRRILGNMLAWFDEKGLTLLRAVTTGHLEEFEGTWEKQQLSTISVYQTMIASFFRWCVKKQHITGLTQNPCLGVERVTVKNRKQTPPFTRDEMNRILAAVGPTAQRRNWTERKQRRMFALILLQRYSGLAANDALCLERSRLELGTGRLATYRNKSGEFVYVRLPQFVVLAILACTGDGTEKYFFWGARGLRSTATSAYAVDFKHVLDEAHVQTEHCFMKSHRLRDTFAVEFLSNGGSMEELAQLLGHSSVDTTREHYNPWDKRRQEKLDAAVERTWQDVPAMEKLVGRYVGSEMVQ